MCGIAGVLFEDGETPDKAELVGLAKALAHRGPDGEGIWTSSDGKAGFVHRRLAILDTSERGHQPMHSSDNNYTIVFNGEIFNFLELREELSLLGSRFSSDSDTEVILAAWHHWGESMLLRFNGMWALALRDNLSGEVFFARDRFGIKPLLYAHVGKRLAFASEMRALRTLSWVPAEIDMQVARRLLFDPFSVEGSARTLMASIQRLPPGHSARWSKGQVTVCRWWKTVDHLTKVPATPGEQSERFHELFADAIKIRMRSDVTMGTCLSGGFDSSAIVCAMAEVAKDATSHLREATVWRHAFIASFPGQSNDETPQALEAAAWAGVKPHVFDLSEVDDSSVIETILQDLDEIHIGLPAAPWQIYRTLRSHGTLVSLDGHGADELMGGYRQGGSGVSFALRNQVTSLSLRSPALARLLDSAKLAWLSARGLAFLRGHRAVAPPALELPADEDVLPAHWGPMNRRLYRMFHSTVLPTILRNFDRLSMAHGVEVRMPFMDWRLVTYVMSLPDSAKLEGELSKAVARNAMIGRMPESIRANPTKLGFNSPMPEWLNGSLSTWVDECLSTRNASFEDIVNVPALKRRVSELTSNRNWDWESAGRLWPYIQLKWLLDGQASAALDTSQASPHSNRPINKNYGLHT